MFKLQCQLQLEKSIANKFRLSRSPFEQPKPNKIALADLKLQQDDTEIRENYLKYQVPQFSQVYHMDKFLKSLGAKIQKKEFRYGEQILKEGEVPEGLHMLVYGECKVLLKNVGERRLLDNHNVSKPLHSKNNNDNYKFPP